MAYKKFLTFGQVQDVLKSHCDRVISAMSYEDLQRYAKIEMMKSFNKFPGQLNTDIERLIDDIAIQEDNDWDSINEFLLGCGIATHVVDMIMKEHEF
jgi:hypothetical protein